MDRPIVVADRIATASAVVALESSVLAQGLPSPANLESAEAQSVAVSKSGAEPAVVGVMGGRIVVGADPDQVRALASGRATWKVTVRDLPYVVTRKLDGATTVSATVFAAERVGIDVMATGGIGGIHFGTADVSADLPQLARSRLVNNVEEVVDLLRVRRALESPGALVLVQNPPAAAAMDPDELAELAAEGAAAARNAGVVGKARTPFELDWLHRRTGGRSLAANLALLEANAGLAGEVAAALALG
jgi:pseudouridine-5'-phosphate glycosidase